MADDKTIAVKVAVRARPLNLREKEDGCRQCLQFGLKGGQLTIDNRPFNFDYVFDSTVSQEIVYESCAFPLIEKLFEGYNSTVFAYGQTGSGKTYTMGTEESMKTASNENRGIIPRMVQDIFTKIDETSNDYGYILSCSMLEIYEEKVFDLLSDKSSDKIDLAIREHPSVGIFVENLSQSSVSNFIETLKCLEQGCLIRTKGETAMNTKSSRSHAIFTLFIQKSSKSDPSDCCRAKLNLVDLAGSERLKKTQAEGERKREGIKINEGLLALGNVISALTDTSQQRSHIPYRDSKLTRLLQDSLGGNSHTVMITCVSPADTNHDETLNSLRYAERAKKIKNKPTVNLDPSATEVIQLRRELQELQHQLLQCQTDSGAGTFSSSNFRELDELKKKNEQLNIENFKLSSQVTQMIVEQATLIEKIAMVECERDKFKEKINELKSKVNVNCTQLETSRLSIEARGDERKKQIDFLRDIHQQLDELQDSNHETSYFEDNADQSNKDTDDDEDDFDEDKFKTRQCAATKELCHLLRQIKEKEELINGAASNHEQMERLKAAHQKEMCDLTEKIESMQNERRDLESKLQNVEGKTSKISETRRKRLQELEKQLSEYKKKLTEMQKLEKMKQQSDQNVKKLREEVASLKQMRVQLVRQLRADNQRFREWQTRTEKQMNQMKIKEKRHEFEAQKAKRNFDQQLTVHRRKYEEAVAFTKRLQTQLHRQTSLKNDKFNELQENERLIKEVKNFVEQEVDLVVSTEQAKNFCENLILQRKDLTKQLHKLEKRRAKVDDESSDVVQADMDSLQKEISLRNVEIQELQRRISSFDADAAEERRWSSVHTVVYAKCALKILFNIAIASKIECSQADSKMTDAMMNCDEACESLKKREEALEQVKSKMADDGRHFDDKLRSLELQQYRKMSYLLRQLFHVASGGQIDEEMAKIMQMHCEEAEKLQLLTEQMEQVHEEKLQLTKELSKAKVRGRKTSSQYFPQINKKRGSDESDENRKLKRSRTSRTRMIQSPERLGRAADLREEESTADESAASLKEEDEQDSDYRETPMHKRVVKLLPADAPEPKRRNTFTVPSQCNCRRGACSNMTCGCAKRKTNCTSDCNCTADVCKNRIFKLDISPILEAAAADKTFDIVIETPSPSVGDKQAARTAQASCQLVLKTPNVSPIDSVFKSPIESAGLQAFNRKTLGGKLFGPVTPSMNRSESK